MKSLVAIARDEIARALERPGPPISPREGPEEGVEPAWLAPGAAFVTLTRGGVLRGCIGSLEAHRPLLEDVRANACAAAFRDPRFPPLTLAELPEIEVEVSILSPPRPLAVASEAEAWERLRPHQDGVVLSFGRHRATFLPQVWESLPEPRVFLAHLKQKAGLPPGFWHPDVRLETYSVEKLKES